MLGVLGKGGIPLVLGGDHSVAVGTVSGVSQFFRTRGEKIGLIWLDAHADMNTPESSPSGNVHGMPLACLVGIGPPELTRLFGYQPKVNPRNAVVVGLRDVDAIEKPHVRDSGVRAFTMRHIDERGLRSVMEEAISAATQESDHRRFPPLARIRGFRRSQGRPRRRHARPRRRHLP